MKIYSIVSVFILLNLSSCHIMDQKHQRREIIKAYVQSYNNFDVEGMLKDLHVDVVFENYINGALTHKTEGKEAFREQAEAAKRYFQSREQKVEVWNFNDEAVTININYNAVLATDLPNGMKKGDTLDLKGTTIFKFEEEEIILIRDES